MPSSLFRELVPVFIRISQNSSGKIRFFDFNGEIFNSKLNQNEIVAKKSSMGESKDCIYNYEYKISEITGKTAKINFSSNLICGDGSISNEKIGKGILRRG